MSKEIIQFDQAMFETKLDTMVREKVERIVNAMLDAEADEIANAARYERTGERKAYRAGHYERKLTAKAGRLALKVPKLKGAVFESAVIERYRRREQSVEESLIDMYLAGVSTRQVDDISQLLWGDRMPSQTLSDKLRKVYEDIDSWAHEAVGIGVSVRVHGRRVAQALLGRARGERERARRHRRGLRGPPGGHRRRRGHEGGRGQLGAVRQRHDRTRPQGRPAGGRRPVRRARLHGQFHAAEGEMPAVHGALHAQRALQDAAHPQAMGVGGPEGDIRHGIPGIRPGKGGVRRRGDGGQEAEGRRELPARGGRRDDHVPAAGVPGRTPQAHPHEQHDRAIEPGDPAAHARRGQLPRREQRPHARLREDQIRHQQRMVDPPLPRHVPTR